MVTHHPSLASLGVWAKVLVYILTHGTLPCSVIKIDSTHTFWLFEMSFQWSSVLWVLQRPVSSYPLLLLLHLWATPEHTAFGTTLWNTFCACSDKNSFHTSRGFPNSTPAPRGWVGFVRLLSDQAPAFNHRHRVTPRRGPAVEISVALSFPMQVTVPAALLHPSPLPVAVGRVQACHFKVVKQLLWGDTLHVLEL